jgi:hypothetical protein
MKRLTWGIIKRNTLFITHFIISLKHFRIPVNLRNIFFFNFLNMLKRRWIYFLNMLYRFLNMLKRFLNILYLFLNIFLYWFLNLNLLKRLTWCSIKNNSFFVAHFVITFNHFGLPINCWNILLFWNGFNLCNAFRLFWFLINFNHFFLNLLLLTFYFRLINSRYLLSFKLFTILVNLLFAII